MDAKLNLNIIVIIYIILLQFRDSVQKTETLRWIAAYLWKDAYVLLWYQSQEPNRVCSLTDLVVY